MRQLNITIKNRTYTINSPNIGNIIDLEEAKARLSNGNYNAIIRSNTGWSLYALDLIDMTAAFQVFVPQLLKDSNLNSYREMDVLDLAELKQVYNTQFLPWYIEAGRLLGVIEPEPEIVEDPTTTNEQDS